ncbi:MAG: hypothetical protein HYR84_11670 [Planctomycetes bacterium]|nr:hypothetical protein [Planctomycetota bacterium]
MPTLNDFPNHSGAAPGHDGAVNWYFWDRDQLRIDRAPVIYVNGMNTVANDHMLVALVLSAALERYIIGVYNLKGIPSILGFPGTEELDKLMENRKKKDKGWRLKLDKAVQTVNAAVGFIADVVQCAEDKIAGYTPLGLTGGPPSPELFAAWADDSGLTIDQAIKVVCGGNKATLALLDELMRRPKPVTIVCHSQGNIITANAIFALSCLYGHYLHGMIRVISLASPVTFWPPGIRLFKFAFTNDPIAFLSLGSTFVHSAGKTKYERADGTKSGMMEPHDALNYLGEWGTRLKAIADGGA